MTELHKRKPLTDDDVLHTYYDNYFKFVVDFDPQWVEVEVKSDEVVFRSKKVI